MRLYYYSTPARARRALLTAQYLHIKLDLTLIDLGKGAQRSPEFQQLNPNQKVPVLEHDGFVLWESYAIMQYLADTTPNQTLYPTELKARADVNRWLFWCGQHFMPGIGILNWENTIKGFIGLGSADLTEVARGEQLLKVAAKVLDDHLADKTWICSSGVSLADLALAAPLADQVRSSYPLEGFAHVQRWFQQVQALEAWQLAFDTKHPG